MSFASRLIHTCTIEDATLAQNSRGEMIPTWTATASSVPCRMDTLIGGQAREFEIDKEIAVSTHILFLKAGQAISERSRVLFGGEYYNVLAAGDPGGQGHHIECDCRLVRN